MGRRRSLHSQIVGWFGIVVLGLAGWVLAGVFKAVDAIGLPGIVALLVVTAGVWGFIAWERKRSAQVAEEARRQALGNMTLEQVDLLSGSEFEEWVAERLRGEGFKVEVTRASGDFGVDLIASVDDVRIGIQAKRWRGPVGNQAVQAVNAGCDYFDCWLGAVVTTSRFTAAAVQQAERSRRRILLVSRAALPELAVLLRRAAR